VGVPTLREPHGQAQSKRNQYHTAQERRKAPEFSRVLRDIAAALAREPGVVRRETERGLAELAHAGFDVEYLEIRDAESLAPVRDVVTAAARILAAVHLGRTRLIDNVPVAPSSATAHCG
jgi:pantoate--beta-alanine ligase